MEALFQKIENRLHMIRANGFTKDEGGQGREKTSQGTNQETGQGITQEANQIITREKSQGTSQYQCSLCKDLEYIIIEKSRARECSCKEAKDYQRRILRSGISEVFQQKNFENFTITNESILLANAKAMAQDYVEGFHEIAKGRHHSIAFLGQVGSGKTHLSISIANELMKKNIGVLYMQYREAMTALKQNILDEASYQGEIAKYKSARVLLIDDLYKGKISPSDHNIMFEIINYRYLKGAPLILSSEYTVDRLLEFDEAIGSRIIEMCRGRMMEFEGMELNHRLIL